jgi:CRISPR-associated protein Cst1
VPIQIDAEQWPMAAGCIGLAKLYSEEELPRTESGVMISKEILNSLAEKYIRGLIEEFSIVKRDVHRLEWYAIQVEKKPEQTKQMAADVRKSMSEQYKKVEKYFSETEECKRFKYLLEMLKDLKDPNDAPKIRESLESYKEIMKTPFINERLTLNFAKAVILNPFYGQTSILQPSFNSKSTEEHIAQIEKDFIQPAKLELDFANVLSSANRKEDIITFLEESHEYKPFKDLLKPLKKLLNTDEICEYLKNEELPCSFIEGLMATQSYEEMTFSPLSFSKHNAVNFNWNFDKQLPVPISALARLVMFMAPFGMAFYSRRVGNMTVNETLRFSGLFITQKHFAEVIKENVTYQRLRREGSSFEEAIVGILHETVDKAKKIKNSYFFLEVYSNYQMKKTLLDYYHMPIYLASYLSKYGKTLDLLLHRDIKDAFFRTVLKGIDPKEVIFEYLREAIAEPFHASVAYHAARERKRILEAKKGVNDVTNFDKTISFVYYRGSDLRKVMVNERSGGQEGEPYRASGRKKIEGIAYRLLNSAKAGNKSAFMDTIFRIHMAAGLDVPSILVDSFKEEGLDFETISSAFIAGLLGQEQANKEKGEVTNG